MMALNYNTVERTIPSDVPSLITRVRMTALYLLSCALFALGAAIFYLVVIARTVGAGSSRTHILTRRAIHNGARLLFYTLDKLSLVDTSRENISLQDFARTPSVIIANHPSMLDAMLLLSLVPNGVCIMKPSLLRIPVVRGFARRAGYIPYGAVPEVLAKARESLASGASIIIFPEGTRSWRGVMGEFHRGAVRIAIEAGVPTQVVAIRMDPVVLGRGVPWWRPPSSLVRYQAVRIEVPEVESGFEYSDSEKLRMASIERTKSLEEMIKISLS